MVAIARCDAAVASAGYPEGQKACVGGDADVVAFLVEVPGPYLAGAHEDDVREDEAGAPDDEDDALSGDAHRADEAGDPQKDPQTHWRAQSRQHEDVAAVAANDADA